MGGSRLCTVFDVRHYFGDEMSRISSTGLRSWMLQRITAIYIALFLIYSLVFIAIESPMRYSVWRHWIGGPVMNAMLGLFALSLFVHAWIGVKDIILDYVKPVSLRILLLSIIACTLISMAIWMLRILFIVGME